MAAFERAAAQDKARRVNALEVALERSPDGRRCLDLLGEIARWRLHEALAGELVRSSTEQVRNLRRALDSRDDLDQQRAASALPNAEATHAKWCKAAQNYALRRELAEAALRDAMRAFAL